jgi:PAS domain S-box-containing protein
MANAVPPNAHATGTQQGSAALAVGRYALAATAVAAALGSTLIIRYATTDPTFFAFYAAIFASIWFGGRGPGLMSLGLSLVALYAFVHDVSDPILLTRELPTLISCLMSALTAELLSGRRHRAERALKAAGERLELAVKERTEELRQVNEDLRREVAEREHAEEALRASEARWRAVFETSSVGIATSDTSGRILTANPAFQAIVGYSEAELQAREWRDLYHPDESILPDDLSADLMAGRRAAYQLERRYIRKDGEVIWVSVNASYVSVEIPPFFALLIVDITQRKRTELERRRLASLVEQAADLMAIANLLDGTPIYLNKAGLKMVGFDSWLEARSRRGIHYLFPEDRQFVNEVLWPTVLEKGSWSGELRFRHFKTGEPIPLLYSAFRIDDPETGRPVNVGNVCRDISERKRAEQALRASEARWRSVFETSTVGVMMSDATCRFTSANSALQHMVGYGQQDIVRLDPLDLIHEDERPRTAELLAEMLSGRRRSYQIETRYRRKDGEIIWVSVYCSHVPGSETVPDFYQSIVIDITERKRAEAEAQESDRRYREAQMVLEHANRVATMGQLTATIAHEVNQPIAATLTNAQAALRWLGAQSPNLEEVRQALDCIVKDTDRAGEVIGRIRALIRKAPRRKDSVDINEAVHEVVELTRGEMVKNSVSVHTNLADGLPLIEGDRVQLQQVILNLILNAVQAMGAVADETRELLITTAQAKPLEVLVAVKDSGPGLAADDFERILHPFYTTKPGGLGMGLSICRSIIEAHEGRLWVTANVPRGAIFHFTVVASPSG